MEFVSGGELFTHLCKRRFFPVESARMLLGELALSLKFIHSFNVAYRGKRAIPRRLITQMISGCLS
jgi:serine/threonine protein kinase